MDVVGSVMQKDTYGHYLQVVGSVEIARTQRVIMGLNKNFFIRCHKTSLRAFIS